MVRAAILDDYQGVALKYADWSPVAKDVEIKVFDKPFAGQDEAIKALQGFAVVVGMRERTPFPRKIIEALPDLKLLITTGGKNNSFDIKAAAERGVTICGTGSRCPRWFIGTGRARTSTARSPSSPPTSDTRGPPRSTGTSRPCPNSSNSPCSGPGRRREVKRERSHVRRPAPGLLH